METKEILLNIKKVLDSNISDEEKEAIREVGNVFVDSISCSNCHHEKREYTHGPIYLSCNFDESVMPFQTRTYDQCIIEENVIIGKTVPTECPIKKIKF